MEPRPKSRLVPAMIAAWMLCGLLAGYAASYVLVSNVVPSPGSQSRCFGAKWTCAVYCPAGWLEARFTGVKICLMHKSTRGTPDYDVFDTFDP